MIWNNHLKEVPEGSHAFLGASKYSWLNYDEEKLKTVYKNLLAKEEGTKLHTFAKMCIDLKIKLPRTKKTLNMYVNDAIGYRMRAEQPLYYSVNCFGTADSIIFKDGLLRVHDLKTGTTPASLHQLEIYAALFCLEYKQKPGDINFELRIYQNDDILIGIPDAEVILPIMDKIKTFDKIIESIKLGE
ncbi:MAG TPA: hypothetical protein DCL29_05475 [Eubacterium sp.]|nr:hypothetical protein [Eubacterium sp.]